MVILVPQINRYLQRCKSPNDKVWQETDQLHKKGWFPAKPVKKGKYRHSPGSICWLSFI